MPEDGEIDNKCKGEPRSVYWNDISKPLAPQTISPLTVSSSANAHTLHVDFEDDRRPDHPMTDQDYAVLRMGGSERSLDGSVSSYDHRARSDSCTRVGFQSDDAKDGSVDGDAVVAALQGWQDTWQKTLDSAGDNGVGHVFQTNSENPADVDASSQDRSPSSAAQNVAEAARQLGFVVKRLRQRAREQTRKQAKLSEKQAHLASLKRLLDDRENSLSAREHAIVPANGNFGFDSVGSLTPDALSGVIRGLEEREASVAARERAIGVREDRMQGWEASITRVQEGVVEWKTTLQKREKEIESLQDILFANVSDAKLSLASAEARHDNMSVREVELLQREDALVRACRDFLNRRSALDVREGELLKLERILQSKQTEFESNREKLAQLRREFRVEIESLRTRESTLQQTQQALECKEEALDSREADILSRETALSDVDLDVRERTAAAVAMERAVEREREDLRTMERRLREWEALLREEDSALSHWRAKREAEPAKAENESFTALADKLEALEQREQAITSAEVRIGAKEAALERRSVSIEDDEKRVKTLEDAVQSSKTEIARKDRQLQEHEKTLSIREKAITRREAELQRLLDDLKERQTELRVKEDELRAKPITSKLNEFKPSVNETAVEIRVRLEEVQRLEARAAEREKAAKALEAQALSKMDGLVVLERTLEARKQAVADHEAALDRAEAAIKKRESELDSLSQSPQRPPPQRTSSHLQEGVSSIRIELTRREESLTRREEEISTRIRDVSVREAEYRAKMKSLEERFSDIGRRETSNKDFLKRLEKRESEVVAREEAVTKRERALTRRRPHVVSYEEDSMDRTDTLEVRRLREKISTLESELVTVRTSTRSGCDGSCSETISRLESVERLLSSQVSERDQQLSLVRKEVSVLQARLQKHLGSISSPPVPLSLSRALSPELKHTIMSLLHCAAEEVDNATKRMHAALAKARHMQLFVRQLLELSATWQIRIHESDASDFHDMWCALLRKETAYISYVLENRIGCDISAEKREEAQLQVRAIRNRLTEVEETIQSLLQAMLALKRTVVVGGLESFMQGSSSIRSTSSRSTVEDSGLSNQYLMSKNIVTSTLKTSTGRAPSVALGLEIPRNSEEIRTVVSRSSSERIVESEKGDNTDSPLLASIETRRKGSVSPGSWYAADRWAM